MRDGSWSTGTAREVAPVVTGVPGIAVGSVSITRELPSTLPGQAAAVGGRSAATAGLQVKLGAPVHDRVGTPWSRRDWPRPGDPVTIGVTDGVNTHPVFTGRVDGTSSSFADAAVDVSLVDNTDDLTAQVSAQALFREMPPRATDGSQRARMTGLLNTYVPSLAARTAGYFNTPQMQDQCLVSVPMVGSTWPERGVLDQSYRSTDVGEWGRFHPGALTDTSAGTIYMSNLYASYVPDPYAAPWAGGITAEKPLTITLGARSAQATSSYVECQWSWGAKAPLSIRSIRLAVTSNRSVVAQFVKDDAAPVTIVSIVGGDAGPWEYASLRIRRMSATVLEWQVITDTGVVKTARTTSTTTGTVMMDNLWERVRVRAPEGCALNGVQVGYPSGPTPAETFRRTFVFRPDSPLRSMTVVPALAAEPAGELLHAQAEAELAAVWLDEDGILRWLGRRRMLEQPIMHTLTSADIADASVETSAQDVRRKVAVKYTAWATRVSRKSTITLYEGGQDEYRDDDLAEAIISPPAEEQWVQVDSTLREVYAGDGSNDFNSGEGSFHGWTALTKAGDEMDNPGTGRVLWDFNRIGPSAWKWSLEVRWPPAKADRIKTATRSDPESWLKPSYRGKGLPLLRGMGVATSSEEVATSAARGPVWAPDLELDAGWFVQSEAVAKDLAEWVAAELAEQRPVVSGLKVRPDPRLQLGDKIRISEPVRTGLSLVGVVTALPQTIGPGQHEMTLSLAVHEVTLEGVTFGDFDDWYSGMTLGQVKGLFQGKTNQQHDTAPLRA